MTPTNTLLVTAFLADTPEDIKCLTSSDYGKPVYLRIIETMTECDEMKQVVITDIDLCAAAARTYGFKVLNPVGEDQNKEPYLTINEHISNSKGSFFYQFNTIIVLDRHYPFVSSETIKQAFKNSKKITAKHCFLCQRPGIILFRSNKVTNFMKWGLYHFLINTKNRNG